MEYLRYTEPRKKTKRGYIYKNHQRIQKKKGLLVFRLLSIIHLFLASKPTQPPVHHLTQKLINLLPPRPTRPLSALLSQQLHKIQLPNPRMQIHIMAPHKRRLVNDLVDQIHNNHHRRSKINLKEILDQFRSRVFTVSDRCESSPELCNENETI